MVVAVVVFVLRRRSLSSGFREDLRSPVHARRYPFSRMTPPTRSLSFPSLYNEISHPLPALSDDTSHGSRAGRSSSAEDGQRTL